MQESKIVLNRNYSEISSGSFFAWIQYLLFALLVFYFFPQNKIIAQQKDRAYLDSLFNTFVSSRSFPGIKQPQTTSLPENIKCGFPLAAEVKNNLSFFTAEQQLKLAEIMQRPQLETSIVSPSGYFRIHFNLTGSFAPAYDSALSATENAMQVAIAFDSSYNYEINYLGYPPPPPDNAGGDNKYDVYIYPKNDDYGSTQPESSVGETQATSYIYIHHHFQAPGFYAKGLAAARVTAAHEFHHAITIGNYRFREEDTFFMELTATSMEEFVYDDVNDYYNYIRSYFNNTSRSFNAFEPPRLYGYDIAIWNIFMADTLGIDIIKRQWELINDNRALDAINISLQEFGSSYLEMMNNFGVWCFFTGYRHQEDLYFEEAEHYPVIRSMVSEFSSGNPVVLGAVPPASNTYITIVDSAELTPDSITVAITNGNVLAANNTPEARYEFQYTLYDYPKEGAIKLTDKYYFEFTPHDQYWVTSEMFPDQVIRGGLFIPAETDFVFPSPYYYSRHNAIHIPVEELTLEESYLNVYTASMNLVYSSPVTAKKVNQKEQVIWNARDNNGDQVPTGVYIYSLKMGDKIITGKIAIFNE